MEENVKETLLVVAKKDSGSYNARFYPAAWNIA
jgi:hypothetical protein